MYIVSQKIAQIIFITAIALVAVEQFLADRVARSVIGTWHHNVVCLSVCPSVTLCIVGLRVGIEG